MHSSFNTSQPRRFTGGISQASDAFSLVELLMVMALITVMMSFLVPAFNGIQGGQNMTKAAYDVAGALEQARTYAMANNTFVWVGFYEEDPSKSAGTAGTGRLIISVVASQNGARYSDSTIDAATPAAFGQNQSSNQTPLIQISKLIKIDNVHAGTLNTNGANNYPSRPPAQTAYQVGDASFESHVITTGSSSSPSPNVTTFTYPLNGAGANQAKYTFKKIIEFNAQGEASKIVENVFTGPGPQDRMEIGLQPTHGNVVDGRYADTKAAAVVQVEGITGQVQIFRP